MGSTDKDFWEMQHHWNPDYPFLEGIKSQTLTRIESELGRNTYM